jgi:lipopolysaccharide export system protein LptA
MKTLRILLLLAVTAMLAVVVSDYLGTQRAGSALGIEEPEAIPRNLDSKASRFTWSQSSSSERKVEIHADTFEQIRDTTLLRLRGVELLIFRRDTGSYDRIVCDSARFDGDTLYSEEEVTVLLGLTPEDPAQGSEKTTKIRSTGVTFQSKTGVASSDSYTEYEFEGGSGHSLGSFYDSVHRYFRMNSDAYVEQQSSTPGQPPLKIRAGELTYYELGQRVDLKNGASLERGSQTMEAAEAIVHLDKGVIRKITATEARGVEQQASRLVRFETPRLEALYSPRQILEHIFGEGPSVMTSETSTSVIRAEGNRIDLNYETREGAEESVLRDTHVQDSAVLEAKPAPGSGTDGRIRRISSQALHLKMSDDAKNMEFVETRARGRLELLPPGAGGPLETLDADHIQMFYGESNRMEKLQAAGNVALERKPGGNNPKAAALQTYSGNLLGEFDPDSGEMRSLRQWGKFRFTRGDREGRAEEARFELATNRIELTNQAQVWDPKSRTSAQRMTLDDNTGDFSAQGEVSSVYQERPAKDTVAASAPPAETTADFFSPAEPLYATAERMVSNQRSGRLEYHGKARLWQGADRIEAESIVIERPQKKLSADKNVVSVIAEKDEGSVDGGSTKPEGETTMSRPTEVRADAMKYDETKRQVEYDVSVELRRGALRVNAKELDAWLSPPGEANRRLEKAIARGAVEVVEASENGVPPRKGFGDQAHFLPAEEKVILQGEPARVVNARQDTTRGSELTYYLNDDRLLVLGSAEERSYSLRRKREP